MDQQDAMSFPGGYYMQRGIVGSGFGTHSGLHRPHGISPLTTPPNPSFPSNIGANSVGSTMPIPPSPEISPRGVYASDPSSAPRTEPAKKKRGRPRKYGPEGPTPLVLSPSSSTSLAATTSTRKPGSGRPRGSGKKQLLASLGSWLSSTAGTGFTPHVITIAVGEDIAAKIVSFSQQGPRTICILSATGAISTVTLGHPSTSGGTLTYEGRFEIVSLSGSYFQTDDGGGSCSRTGSISILLASPEGRLIGGGVGGVLIAATPVRVIVGSFIWGSGSKPKKKAKDSSEGGGDSDRQTVDDSTAPTDDVQPTENLTPASSFRGWPCSRPGDIENAHVDIDLMRG